MKILESSPSRYDMGIRILTFGMDMEVKKKIVSEYISEGDHVLDIGVGTGTLAVLCAQKGAYVFGFDISSKMLEIARKKVKSAGLEEKVHLEEMSVVEMDTHLKENSFDVVVAALVFSELSETEQIFTLKQCYRVLKPNGRLIIEDEVKPKSLRKKIAYYIVHLPLALITYIISQSLTKPVKGIEKKLSEAGFEIESCFKFFCDSLILIVARKVV
jgi:demethylmenaquinone methyltransferase/2-methoxy-6-polyprenyl-1,4-benzoquinol methylase